MENPNQLKCNECYSSVDGENEASFFLSFFFLGEKLYLIAFIRLSIKSFFVTMWTLKLLVVLREELHGKCIEASRIQDQL